MSSVSNPLRLRVGSVGRAVLLGFVALLASASLGSGLRAQSQASPVLRLPADAVYERRVGPDSAVVFRHGTHVALLGRCTECHSGLFRILTSTDRITHAEMNAGRSCGACHDGRHAFGVGARESCAACHVGRKSTAAAVVGAPSGGERPPSFRGPKPIRYTPSDVSLGSVTFDHATHVKGGCAQCHSRLFPMKSSAVKPRDGMHEVGACGACHDGKRSFGVEDQKSCARCHEEGAR